MSRWSITFPRPGRRAAAHADREQRAPGSHDGGAWTEFGRPTYRTTDAGERVYAGMALLSSAALITKSQIRSVVGRKQPWASEAWDLYHEAPELRFGVSWAANACSRARLYVGRIDPDGSSDPVPLDIPRSRGDSGGSPAAGGDFEEAGMSAHEAAKTRLLLAPLDELAGGRLAQARMLKRMATQLDVVGESYLLGFDDPASGERRWLVCSPDELKPHGQSVKIASPDVPGQDIEVPIARTTIVRIWRPDDQFAHQADSPVRALRTTLKELLDLSAHIRATAESRLAGAGVFFVPEELAAPRPEQSESGVNPLHSDPFTAALLESMITPLQNRDSASAVVPLIIRGPAEAGDKLKHISFSTPFDERVADMREGAIRRVATGLDMPPEVLLGMGDANHWSAWALEESALKLHIEPRLGLLCDALTSHFYQPALRALGVPDWHEYVIWYSTSDLALRPNRAPEAAEAYDKGAISEATYRRALGFSDDEGPSENERAARLADHIVKTNANLAPILLPRLGIPLSEQEKQDADPQGTPAPMGAVSNTSSKPGAPEGAAVARSEIPAQRAAPPAAASMTAHSGGDRWLGPLLEMAVRRALSRAGQHLIRSTPRARRTELQQLPLWSVHTRVPPDEAQLDHMLGGAYSEFTAATPEETCLHRAVDGYVRALLTAGEEHRAEYLQRAITQFGCE